MGRRSAFALAIRGEPTLPWVERTIIPYRAIAAACVEHAPNGECDWETYDLSDKVTIEVDGASFAITRHSKAASITITGAVHEVMCPDLGMVVHGLREDALPQTLISPRVFGQLEALGGNSWRMGSVPGAITTQPRGGGHTAKAPRVLRRRGGVWVCGVDQPEPEPSP